MTDWDREMQKALEADGEKLRQLTGEDHGPWLPCPHCFESSGYEARYIPATWTDPAWEDTDYSRPCTHCNGTGHAPVEPEPVALDQGEDIAF